MMKLLPRTKAEAAAFAASCAAVGALIMIVAQAYKLIQCPAP